jgi:hypothetical protein
LSLTEPQQKKIAENGINLQKNINCCYNKKEDHFFRFTIGIPKKNHSLIRALVGEQK